MNKKIEMLNQTNAYKIDAFVTNIEWERVTLNIYIQIKINEPLNPNIPLDFFMVNDLYSAKAKFRVKQLNNNLFYLSLNVTNPGNNRCLPIGTYSIIVCQDNYILTKCLISPNITTKMDDYSRNFLYNNRSKVYSVTFYIDNDYECMPFIIYVLGAVRQTVPFFKEFNLPCFPQQQQLFIPYNNNSKFYSKIRWKIKFRLNKKKKKKLIVFAYQHLSKLFPNKENKIMFMSEQSNKLGANLTSVYNRIVERNLDEKYKIYFSARKASSERQGRLSWFKLICKLSKCSKVFIDDHAPIFDWLKLGKDVELIQLWHAGAGFKSSGYSRWGHKGCPGPNSCHRQYKYGIAGSKHIAPFFSEVFGINDEQILPTGMPRMDEYLDNNYRDAKTKELYDAYPVCKGKKVILFAPTYRGKNRKTAYYPYELIDFNRLFQFCNDEYVVMFKMHPWVSEEVPINPAHAEVFIDVGTYPNINDLFYITDLLITDYSSNIFEFSLMKKPMLFYSFDKIQYSFSRGFHRNYEESAPGKVCYNFEEIINALENKDFEYKKVEEYIKKHFDYIDSHASDRVIDWILLGNLPDDIKKSIEDKYEEISRLSMLNFSSMKPEIDSNGSA